jgi:indole-3-glycerol phosphate synthase
MAVKTTVLDRILAKKREEVAELRQSTDMEHLKRQADQASEPRDFLQALRACPHVPIIAEIKKASPSLGDIRTGFHVGAWAKKYEAGGAAALSVLTDGPFFGGCLADLEEARTTVGIPVLRKDFIIDPVQIFQARSAGADAILLIVAALDRNRLEELFRLARALGMTPLVEVHTAEELESALRLDPPLIGINNRDLTTLDVSLDTSLTLRPMITNDALVVSESGITGPENIRRLKAGGIDAFLVGTLLMKTDHPESALKELCQAAV